MASKDEVEAACMSLFMCIGLEETVAKNAAKNAKFSKTLEDVIHEAGAASGCPKGKGNLLYTVASKYPANALCHRPMLLGYVMCEHMKSTAQLDGAFEYLRKVGTTEVDKKALEEASGVGVVVTAEQIKAAVAEEMEANTARLLEERYRVNLNVLLGAVTRKLKWADGAAVRSVLEASVEALLGPKMEADLAPPEPKKKTKAAPPPKPSTAAPAPPDDPYAFLPKPDANNDVHTTVNFSDGRILRVANTPEALSLHLSRTGGKVVTRFPPEPNGYLHIGHAKAMFVDFGMARHYGGVCYLRYDDTNPEAEKLEYIQHIEEIASWMGWEAWKVTYSSDYFEQLYELAVQLIKSGNAYVCHQTKDEIEASREKREPSPWRERPIEESLRLFEDMRRGMVDEGKATLRMKMDPNALAGFVWYQFALQQKAAAAAEAAAKAQPAGKE
ncbi:Glutamine--tRNA ligase [Tetrabaena socialis]|uniref:Glutamine--tRNA ligase n=1 Tax=Tetrabaena socialis TaxID=47790 RepID=A0A2J8A975_9CHLO|nr:Glutamine--tRNA ligase [Tetrabaena socialis]|eukprot:PNH09069.1 Glutamine--tRNA ligase [Tetrabaena socialis]